MMALRGTDIVRVPLIEGTGELKLVSREEYAEAAGLLRLSPTRGDRRVPSCVRSRRCDIVRVRVAWSDARPSTPGGHAHEHHRRRRQPTRRQTDAAPTSSG